MRNVGHNPEKPRRHHKPMHSARKGRGHDAKLRKRKRSMGDRREECPICHWPTKDVARHKRTNRH